MRKAFLPPLPSSVIVSLWFILLTCESPCVGPRVSFCPIFLVLTFVLSLNCWSKIVLYYFASGPFPLLLSLSHACPLSTACAPLPPPSLPLPLRLCKAARSRPLSRMNPRFPNQKQRELIGKPAGENRLY